MAVTGAGARLHGADMSSLSLLYDFEELEGELDFLTRVVAISLYPAAGRTPLTIGEVHSISVNSTVSVPLSTVDLWGYNACFDFYWKSMYSAKSCLVV